MADVVVKMFGTVTGATTNSVATIDIQDTGFIEAILIDMTCEGMNALSDAASVEIGFSSSNTFTVNDVRSSIAMLRISQNFLTTGGGAQGKAMALPFPTGIRVAAGERVHMHMTAKSGVVVEATAYLYLRTTSRARTSRRNR